MELAPAIDHLLEQQLKVIRIGSADVGRSRIPRNLPRLEDFDVLGGDAEVALVSGCHYVWTDGAGAGNLAVPLFKPALITYQARYVFSVPSEFLNHLTAYQDANGHSVSLRQLLSMQVRNRRTPYK